MHLTDYNLPGLLGFLAGMILDPVLFVPAVVAGFYLQRFGRAIVGGLLVAATYAAIGWGIHKGNAPPASMEAGFILAPLISLAGVLVRRTAKK